MGSAASIRGGQRTFFFFVDMLTNNDPTSTTTLARGRARAGPKPQRLLPPLGPQGSPPGGRGGAEGARPRRTSGARTARPAEDSRADRKTSRVLLATRAASEAKGRHTPSTLKRCQTVLCSEGSAKPSSHSARVEGRRPRRRRERRPQEPEPAGTYRRQGPKS